MHNNMHNKMHNNINRISPQFVGLNSLASMHESMYEPMYESMYESYQESYRKHNKVIRDSYKHIRQIIQYINKAYISQNIRQKHKTIIQRHKTNHMLSRQFNKSMIIKIIIRIMTILS